MAQGTALFYLIGQFIKQSFNKKNDEPYIIFDFFDVEKNNPSIFGGDKEKRRVVKKLYKSLTPSTPVRYKSRNNHHNLIYKPNGCL